MTKNFKGNFSSMFKIGLICQMKHSISKLTYSIVMQYKYI